MDPFIPNQSPPQPQPHPAARPARNNRTRNTLLVVAGVVAALCVGCGVIGAVFADGKPTAPTTAATTPDTGAISASTAVTPGAATATVSAVPVSPAAPKPTVITDGIWTVGEDIPAGTYRPAEPIDPDAFCYWAIYKSGTNQQNIIQNELSGGGLPKVTLKAGQDFKTERCGTWVRQ